MCRVCVEREGSCGGGGPRPVAVLGFACAFIVLHKRHLRPAFATRNFFSRPTFFDLVIDAPMRL